MKTLALLGSLILGSALAEPPETAASLPAQAAADAIRTFAGTDGALLAAGLLKPYDGKELASLLLYPSDEIVVVSLTGAQLRQAFERSASLLPEPNAGFLQLSGFEVGVNRTATPGSRVRTATVNERPLEDGRTYSVAMPSSLGRGGLGYFKIWDRSRIAKTFANATVESAIRGKPASGGSSRWVLSP